jgi:hypothetical protein
MVYISDHKILNLATGEVIRRRQVTMIPMSQHVIDTVQKLAEMEQMPDGLKMTSTSGVTLFDSSWIPGVHMEETNMSDEETASTGNEKDDDSSHEDEAIDENDI